MKSLTAIILSLLTFAFGNSQECSRGEITKEIVIPQEKIEFYCAMPSFDFVDKKVKLAEIHNYPEYISMIDPEAKAVKDIVSKIEKKRKLGNCKRNL